MALALDKVAQDIGERNKARDSSAHLLRLIANEIRDNADKPDEMRELAMRLDQNADNLAQAVVQKTASHKEAPTEPAELRMESLQTRRNTRK